MGGWAHLCGTECGWGNLSRGDRLSPGPGPRGPWFTRWVEQRRPSNAPPLSRQQRLVRQATSPACGCWERHRPRGYPSDQRVERHGLSNELSEGRSRFGSLKVEGRYEQAAFSTPFRAPPPQDEGGMPRRGGAGFWDGYGRGEDPIRGPLSYNLSTHGPWPRLTPAGSRPADPDFLGAVNRGHAPGWEGAGGRRGVIGHPGLDPLPCGGRPARFARPQPGAGRRARDESSSWQRRLSSIL